MTHVPGEFEYVRKICNRFPYGNGTCHKDNGSVGRTDGRTVNKNSVGIIINHFMRSAVKADNSNVGPGIVG